MDSKIINKKHWWLKLLLIFLAASVVVILAFGYYLNLKIKDYKNNNTGAAQNKFEATEGAGNFSFGTSTPKLTIVEFADFACTHSRPSFDKIRSLGLKYKDKVKVVFRNYPYISNYSLDLAIAANCAGKQNKFWQMHDKLFINQGVSKKEEVDALAVQIGLDMNKFNDCFADKYQPQIQNDLLDAQRLGVKGTPVWFFNGYKLEGDMPIETMEKIIKEMIK